MRLWRGCSRHTRNGLSGRVDAAPPAESPRQIPSRAGRSCEGHVVDPRCAPGLAAQQSRQGHPSPAPQPEALDRLVGIDRARSASAGSCSQPGATGYGGKSRSMPVPHCAAGAARRRRSRDSWMNASCAPCYIHRRGFARFPGMEPTFTDICATLWRISHVLGGAAAKVLWTRSFCTVTFFTTPV